MRTSSACGASSGPWAACSTGRSEVATCRRSTTAGTSGSSCSSSRRAWRIAQMAPVDWCPKDQVVLANEQVQATAAAGAAARRSSSATWSSGSSGSPSTPTSCWTSTRSTGPSAIVSMQTNWIGRSEGVEFAFTGRTTTPAARIARVHHAPGHGVRHDLHGPGARASAGRRADHARRSKAEVDAYVDAGAPPDARSSACRPSARRPACPMGAYAINPVNGERLPIWIADYVLASYGTGAIMAVPAHDERDCEFAQQFGLPIRRGRAAPDGADDDADAGLRRVHRPTSVMVNSGRVQRPARAGGRGSASPTGSRSAASASGRSTTACATGWSRGSATGARRSRSSTARRDGIVPVPEDQLPVLLPEDVEFQPTGESTAASRRGVREHDLPAVRRPGAGARRTPWTRSWIRRWYFLRYMSPARRERPFDSGQRRRWLPGRPVHGRRRARGMHLLYSRFFAKVLNDLGLVDFREPFKRLFNQGEILGPDGKRMSKSRGNVVNPDDSSRAPAPTRCAV